MCFLVVFYRSCLELLLKKIKEKVTDHSTTARKVKYTTLVGLGELYCLHRVDLVLENIQLPGYMPIALTHRKLVEMLLNCFSHLFPHLNGIVSIRITPDSCL